MTEKLDILNDIPLTEEQILEANRRHDAQHGSPMLWAKSRVKSGGLIPVAIRGKKLDDKTVEKYAKKGRYSEEYKQGLKELNEAKKREVL